jgi:NarL family two-component system sensor histidine kinase LiaS
VGLDERVHALVSRMGSAYPTNVELTVEPLAGHGADDELLLLVTEALSNALRHSRADNVQVELMGEDDDIVMRVNDDGIGFDTANIGSAGIGLASMKTRSLGLGGEMTVRSQPGSGTRIEVRVPLTSIRHGR